MENKIVEKFGNRLRVRVCGILFKSNQILLVKHLSIGEKGILWAPPGGGMKFGMSAQENLIREFEEETGLKIKIVRFLFTHEFLKAPLHAIELFFEVKITGGTLRKGIDPEMKADEQIIENLKFIHFKDLVKMDKSKIHHALWNCRTPKDLIKKKGFIKFD